MHKLNLLATAQTLARAHTHTNTYAHVHAQTRTYARTHTHAHAHTHTHTFTRTHTHTHTHTHAHAPPLVACSLPYTRSGPAHITLSGGADWGPALASPLAVLGSDSGMDLEGHCRWGPRAGKVAGGIRGSSTAHARQVSMARPKERAARHARVRAPDTNLHARVPRAWHAQHGQRMNRSDGYLQAVGKGRAGVQACMHAHNHHRHTYTRSLENYLNGPVGRYPGGVRACACHGCSACIMHPYGAVARARLQLRRASLHLCAQGCVGKAHLCLWSQGCMAGSEISYVGTHLCL